MLSLYQFPVFMCQLLIDLGAFQNLYKPTTFCELWISFSTVLQKTYLAIELKQTVYPQSLPIFVSNFNFTLFIQD